MTRTELDNSLRREDWHLVGALEYAKRQTQEHTWLRLSAVGGGQSQEYVCGVTLAKLLYAMKYNVGVDEIEVESGTQEYEDSAKWRAYYRRVRG